MRPLLVLLYAALLASGPVVAQTNMGTSSTGQPTTGSSGNAPGSSPTQSGGSLNMGAGSQTQGVNSHGQPSQASQELQNKVGGAQAQDPAGQSGKSSEANMPAASQGGAGGSTSLHGQVNSESGAQPKK